MVTDPVFSRTVTFSLPPIIDKLTTISREISNFLQSEFHLDVTARPRNKRSPRTDVRLLCVAASGRTGGRAGGAPRRAVEQQRALAGHGCVRAAAARRVRRGGEAGHPFRQARAGEAALGAAHRQRQHHTAVRPPPHAAGRAHPRVLRLEDGEQERPQVAARAADRAGEAAGRSLPPHPPALRRPRRPPGRGRVGAPQVPQLHRAPVWRAPRTPRLGPLSPCGPAHCSHGSVLPRGC